MSAPAKAAAAFAALSVAASLPCLFQVTAATLTLLLFVGVPAYLAGLVLYAVELARFVRAHWVY